MGEIGSLTTFLKHAVPCRDTPLECDYWQDRLVINVSQALKHHARETLHVPNLAMVDVNHREPRRFAHPAMSFTKI